MDCHVRTPDYFTPYSKVLQVRIWEVAGMLLQGLDTANKSLWKQRHLPCNRSAIAYTAIGSLRSLSNRSWGIKDRNISRCSIFLLISGLSYKVIWPATPIQPLHVPFFLGTRLSSKKNSICQGQLIPITCSQGVLSCGKKRPQLSWVKVGWCSNFVLLLSFCFTIFLGLEMYLGDVILL